MVLSPRRQSLVSRPMSRVKGRTSPLTTGRREAEKARPRPRPVAVPANRPEGAGTGDRQRHVGVAVLDGELRQGEAVVPGGQDDVLLQAPEEEVPIGGVVGGGSLSDARAPAFPAGLAARPTPRALAVRVFRPRGRGQR